MSAREKKLLIFFAVAGFIVLNFLAVTFFQTKKNDAVRKRDQARVQLETAEMYQASSASVANEMEWLAKHTPEPAANQDVQTQLQKLCEAGATKAGLEIKTQKPLPSDINGVHFHRAKMQLTVSGKEESLYRWLDQLNQPDQLRIATQIRLSPNKKDDTLIDCTATVEQWFVPAEPSA
ncbi:MAG: hypothetical protein ACQCXQ_10430 [Verrucomicrobiales bacterium]|nr:hypothetical protein [Verrucomicrobiota bacterium JB025]